MALGGILLASLQPWPFQHSFAKCHDRRGCSVQPMTSLLSTVLLVRYYVNDQRSWHMEGLETALIVNTHLVLVTLVKLGARFPTNQPLLCRRASTLLTPLCNI